MNVHELARTVREMFAEGADKKLNLTVMSFGFKYGAPSDANYMADMRFIPNPHWVPELRPLTGQDAPVRDYVLEHAGTEEFISNYLAALRPVLEATAVRVSTTPPSQLAAPVVSIVPWL